MQVRKTYAGPGIWPPKSAPKSPVGNGRTFTLYGVLLEFLGVEFLVDFEAAKEAAEVCLGNVSVADDGFAAGGGDAEFQDLGEQALPSCYSYVDQFIRGIYRSEIADNLHG